MDIVDIKAMITLIESAFERELRNTPDKMKILIKQEFDKDVDTQTIANICGITEDYEHQSQRIENGYY